MPNRPEVNDTMSLLRQAKPRVHARDLDHDEALVGHIVADGSAQTRRLRWMPPVAIAATATVAALLVAHLSVTPARTERRLQAPDMRLVAERTTSALSETGRAEVNFTETKDLPSGLSAKHRGRILVGFSGDDIEMTIESEGQQGRPGFTSRNRTVDGEFYLLDGPPGRQQWIHDRNASGTRASDMFSVDPRTLVRMLAPQANFIQEHADQRGRRLRAQTPNRIPELNLGLGATGDARPQSLIVWVTADDVVERLDLTYSHHEVAPGGLVKVRGADGRMSVQSDPAATPVVYTGRSTYSVRFYDLGAPMTITAPEHPTQVDGRG